MVVATLVQPPDANGDHELLLGSAREQVLQQVQGQQQLQCEAARG